MAMAIRAAAQGQGVALGSLAIVADELAAGRLIAPVLDQRQNAVRLLLPLPPGRSGNAAHKGLPGVFGRGGGAIGRRSRDERWTLGASARLGPALSEAAQFILRSRFFKRRNLQRNFQKPASGFGSILGAAVASMRAV